MKIYIGNVEIAGYFMHLKNGFDKLGIQADLWYLQNNKYYNVKVNRLLQLNQRLFSFFKKNKHSIYFPLTIPSVMAMFIIHCIIFIYVLFKYDVFILNSLPFFNYTELSVLKLFKKKIIVVFLGTESRPAYISGNLIQGRYTVNGQYDLIRCHKNVKAQVKKINRIEKYADYIINHPPTALFQKKPFIAWLHIGFPNDNPSDLSNHKFSTSRIVKVLHAPSNAVSKGSDKIIETINKLRKDGFPIEFTKLENVPNEKVLDELEKCDIVLDELYSDIPVGGLGTEAAFAKKPVMNGGYYAKYISADYPEDVIPPAYFFLPENLENELKELILNKEQRKEYAIELNKFVSEKWNSTIVAQKYLKIIQGDIPAEWIYDPGQISYFMGYGIEKNKLKSFLKQYVEKYGEDALFMNDKTKIKSRIIEFIHSTSA